MITSLAVSLATTMWRNGLEFLPISTTLPVLMRFLHTMCNIFSLPWCALYFIRSPVIKLFGKFFHAHFVEKYVSSKTTFSSFVKTISFVFIQHAFRTDYKPNCSRCHLVHICYTTIQRSRSIFMFTHCGFLMFGLHFLWITLYITFFIEQDKYNKKSYVKSLPKPKIEGGNFKSLREFFKYRYLTDS